MKVDFLSFTVLLQAIGLSQSNGSGAIRSSASQRHLYELIDTYEPWSLVTDHAAIDNDLHFIKRQLGVGTSTSWRTAERIYQEGAFSNSVAELNLDKKLTQDIPSGTEVIGAGAQEGFYSLVKGAFYKKAKAGESVVLIKYDVNEVQENYVNCQVGANPNPNTAGCFAEVGSINFLEMDGLKFNYTGPELNYTYDLLKANLNMRSIQSFSTDAREENWDVEGGPYPEYKKFVDYYGKYDYADHMISTAFRGEETDMRRGNQDFRLYGDKGRVEIIQKSMPYMSIWMKVIREMEHAIHDCGADNHHPFAHGWDEAVAFYTGSRYGLDNDNGNLLYSLADKRCMAYRTCGEEKDELDGKATVNYEVFRQFKAGQSALLDGKCDKAKEIKERIVSLMTIPLVQGTMRYAHIVAGETFYEKHASQGTLFAMAVLPMVHACNPRDADTIYRNMKAWVNATVDFSAIKGAFERNYQCLGITCAEVGGIWDYASEDYKYDARPCSGDEVVSSGLQLQGSGAIVGFVLGGVVVVALAVFFIARLGGRGKEKTVATGQSSTGESFAYPNDLTIGEETPEEVPERGYMI